VLLADGVFWGQNHELLLGLLLSLSIEFAFVGLRRALVRRFSLRRDVASQQVGLRPALLRLVGLGRERAMLPVRVQVRTRPQVTNDWVINEEPLESLYIVDVLDLILEQAELVDVLPEPSLF